MQTLDGASLTIVRVGDDMLELPPQVWLVPDSKRAFFYDADGELLS